MFCVLCRRLFWRDPKPGGRLQSRSRTRAVRRAADQARSSVRAMEEQWDERSVLAITQVLQERLLKFRRGTCLRKFRESTHDLFLRRIQILQFIDQQLVHCFDTHGHLIWLLRRLCDARSGGTVVFLQLNLFAAWTSELRPHLSNYLEMAGISAVAHPADTVTGSNLRRLHRASIVPLARKLAAT